MITSSMEDQTDRNSALLFDLPTRVYFGSGVIDELQVPQKKALCLFSPSVDRHINVCARLQAALAGQQAECLIVKRGGGEPSSDAVDQLVKETPKELDAVIGVGGGSTLDTAKFIALLKVSGGQCADYEFGQREITGALPIYLAPTTSGSGSEVTPYAVAQNSDTGRMFTITHRCLYSTKAYVGPALTLGLPSHYTLASGLDAFIHCLEARLNRQGHALIEPLAIRGMQLIYGGLEKALADPDNLEVRTRLSLASVMGGVCIAHSRTGLIHTLSVSFSEFNDDPHGILNARMLPYVLKYNQDHYDGSLAAPVSEFTGEDIRSDQEASERLAVWVDDLLAKVRLSELGTDELGTQVDHITDRIMQDHGLPSVNHRRIDPTTIKQLVEEIIDGEAGS